VIYLLEKTKKIGFLFDYYGKLLTERQQNIIRLYYYHDLSLGEIAEKEDISRQGVYDHLQRGEKILLGYDQKLEFIEMFTNLKDELEKIFTYIEDSSNIENEEKEYLLTRINNLKKYL